jgi:hypothetical protein
VKGRAASPGAQGDNRLIVSQTSEAQVTRAVAAAAFSPVRSRSSQTRRMPISRPARCRGTNQATWTRR